MYGRCRENRYQWEEEHKTKRWIERQIKGGKNGEKIKSEENPRENGIKKIKVGEISRYNFDKKTGKLYTTKETH
jgi:hypothetical protein